MRISLQLESFVTDLTSVLGLWLGVTAVTVAEFFELFADIIVYIFSTTITCMARRIMQKRHH